MGGAKPLRQPIDVSGQVVRYWTRVKDSSLKSFTLFAHQDIGIQKFLDRELKPDDKLMGQISAVYVPPAVKSLDKVNVILFLHGDKVRINRSHFTIREYLALPQMPLRQGLNISGRPFILIAPTLGADADTEFGDLGKRIDDYLDLMMTHLYQLGPPEYAPPSPPKIGDLVITGHSGGFGPIRSILSNISRYKQNIREIWGFDIMYGNTAHFLAAANVPVYAYFNDTAVKSRELASRKLPHVFVMAGREIHIEGGRERMRMVHHDLQMQKFWLDRCRRIGTHGSHPEDKKLMV
jgi:hypothetical protein